MLHRNLSHNTFPSKINKPPLITCSNSTYIITNITPFLTSPTIITMIEF